MKIDNPGGRWYYGCDALQRRTRGIFLMGPTAEGVRTAWRLVAHVMLREGGYDGLIIFPEFEDGFFERSRFEDGKAATVPRISRATQRIMDWETACIDNCTVVLAWMPFDMTSPPDGERRTTLPGFNTRREVSRLMTQRRAGLALGMPDGAVSGGGLLYDAHAAGYTVHETLAATVEYVLHL